MGIKLKEDHQTASSGIQALEDSCVSKCSPNETHTAQYEICLKLISPATDYSKPNCTIKRLINVCIFNEIVR